MFGPGAGSFYMIGCSTLAGCGLIGAMAGARIANFGSNLGSLAIYAFGGHIVVAAGLAVGLGAFLGARLGARLGAEGRRAAGPAADRRRQRAMALKLASAPANAACASG